MGDCCKAHKDNVVEIAWKRELAGCTVAASHGVTKLTPDGKEQTLEWITWEQYLELLNGQETENSPAL